MRDHLEPFRAAASVLIWIAEWSVWPSGERMHIFDRFRLSYVIASPLIEHRGHLLDPEEFEAAVSLASLAVLFLWDCYVLAPNACPGVFYSHDELGVVLQ